jgi:hypothetical protein
MMDKESYLWSSRPVGTHKAKTRGAHATVPLLLGPLRAAELKLSGKSLSPLPRQLSLSVGMHSRDKHATTLMLPAHNSFFHSPTISPNISPQCNYGHVSFPRVSKCCPILQSGLLVPFSPRLHPDIVLPSAAFFLNSYLR